MSTLRRTAMGNAVDIDQLRLANETTIAIGNAKTNARGDLLGAGGKVIKTRAQLMQEYHHLNIKPVSDDYDDSHEYESSQVVAQPKSNVLQRAVQETPATATEAPSYTKPRGSFAESLAKDAEVTQELLDPTGLVGSVGSPAPAGPAGVRRI